MVRPGAVAAPVCALLGALGEVGYAGRVKRPKVIDAEYEIVTPARPSRAKEPWNGIGLPPDFAEWNWRGQLFYVLAMPAVMFGVWWGVRWLVHLLRS